MTVTGGCQRRTAKQAEVKSKAELFKMYQGKGPHRIFADLVSDDDLRSDALILEGVARPIETMCWKDVQAQRDPDN